MEKNVDVNANGVFDEGTRWITDGPDVVVGFDKNGVVTNRYLHGPAIDQIPADENALGEVLWPLTDNQGTVRDLADYNAATNTTTVVNHRKYDSFGNITAESNPSAKFLYAYTGREWDADAQLYYYRARWYDPAIGRFISQDPIGYEGGDPNLFGYVRNSTPNSTDPTGLQPPIMPQGQVPGTSPAPIGLFPDGSTRTLNQNTDPRVLKQMQQGGTAPTGVHRPYVNRGLPANSLQGMGAAIDRPWTLPQNWDYAAGDLIYSYQSVEICDSDVGVGTVYGWLRSFAYFNQGNIASVRIVQPGAFEPPQFDGRQYALFRPTPFGELPSRAGGLNTIQRIFINPTSVAVELFYDDAQHFVTAVTLGNHMIVGVRKWTVREESGDCGKRLIIETEAWEQRNGRANDFAMERGGEDAMGGLWSIYLLNMARQATSTSGSFSPIKEHWDRMAGGQNPFRPGVPRSNVSGPPVPSGYYGRPFAK